MKKLTATIFASLLTVVSVGAANAEIASKDYVDELNTANKTAITTLTGTGEGSVSKTVADEIAKEVSRSDEAYAAKSIETSVTDNADAITKLNADAETAGSVDYKIAQSAEDISNSVKAAQDAADAAQSDVDTLADAVNDTTNGLAATNTIATGNAAAIETINTNLDGKVAQDDYDAQIGTVSATNMGTMAGTVVGAINEVNDAVKDNADNISTNTENIGKNTEAISAVKTIAEKAIPAPTDTCTNPGAKCVLVYDNSDYAWEVIKRGTSTTTTENENSGE